MKVTSSKVLLYGSVPSPTPRASRKHSPLGDAFRFFVVAF